MQNQDVCPQRDTLECKLVESAYASTSDSFLAGWCEARRYQVQEVIGKGSYGVVCSATDSFTGERVAIKKIQNVFDNVADATRILREIKLLRLLKHPGAVEPLGYPLRRAIGLPIRLFCEAAIACTTSNCRQCSLQHTRIGRGLQAR